MIVDPEMVFTLAVTIYEGRLTALFTYDESQSETKYWV
jgi:hypothetical protein